MVDHRMGLRGIVVLGGTILMLVPAIVAGMLYTAELENRAEQLVTEKLAARGEMASNQLARRLHQLWKEVEAFSGRVDPARPDLARADIDFVSTLDRRYTWIGMAAADGKVLAATSGMLEGESVAQRPWFRKGLVGPAAIDVHEAQLLARLLPSAPEPYRFIDLAAPVRDRSGDVAGVLGAHVDWRWVADNLSSLQAPGTELLLLSREQNVLFGPADLVNTRLTVGSAQAAGRVTSIALDERWPDGKDYVTITVPTVGYEDLPSFGWSLLVRQDMEAAIGPTRRLVRDFWLMLGSGALVAVGLLWIGARWVTTPLQRLSYAAASIVSATDDAPPYVETRYLEVSQLSSALVRLQSMLKSARVAEGARLRTY